MSCPPIFYINLDKRPDRRTQVEHALAGFAYERFPAIEHSNGYVGCVESHIQCLEMARDRGFPEVMIVEDDLEWVTPNPHRVVETLMALPFDVAVLCPVLDPRIVPKRIHPLFVTRTNSQTALAYICRQSYYDTLISNFREGLAHLQRGGAEESCVIDQFWKKLQGGENWIHANPTLGKQRAGLSDILHREVNYDWAYLRR